MSAYLISQVEVLDALHFRILSAARRAISFLEKSDCPAAAGDLLGALAAAFSCKPGQVYPRFDL
jgi:hypothetical protein